MPFSNILHTEAQPDFADIREQFGVNLRSSGTRYSHRPKTNIYGIGTTKRQQFVYRWDRMLNGKIFAITKSDENNRFYS